MPQPPVNRPPATLTKPSSDSLASLCQPAMKASDGFWRDPESHASASFLRGLDFAHHWCLQMDRGGLITLGSAPPAPH